VRLPRYRDTRGVFRREPSAERSGNPLGSARHRV